MAILGLFVISFLTCLVTAEFDYCDQRLCPQQRSKEQKHIACENSGEFSESCPTDRKLVNLTVSDKDLILRMHNIYRNKIASGSERGFSPAVRMATMVWCSEMTYLAELNVKKCNGQYDACRNTYDFQFVGQNIAADYRQHNFQTKRHMITHSIKMWYDEVENADQNDIDSCCPPEIRRKRDLEQSNGVRDLSGLYARRPPVRKSSFVGHFTQVVQDRSTKVGCAIAKYTQDGYKTTVMTCDYSFGNVLYAKVYESGDTASNCTTGTNPQFPALCSVDENTLIQPFPEEPPMEPIYGRNE